jgi:chemotaxis protein methyltransferase CheR
MLKEADAKLLLNDLLELYGYDFTGYSEASIERRLERLFLLDKFPSFAEFRYKVRNDAAYLQRVVEEITVNVTEMFRDPSFYQVLRNEVLPNLGSKPFIRIWHAGCSTGEEVYSMAILLHEAKLLHKSLLYATDINTDVLEKARAGVFPLSHMKLYSENYLQSGGKQDFSSYYTANYDGAKFNEILSGDRMLFSPHNLVSDSSFNSFELILCRNVLIYFDKELQERAFRLFDNSLDKLSYLGLGSKESIKFSTIESKYKEVSKEKIWRKML